LAEVTDAGDLPDKSLFVMMVVDREDPKTDTFARVATVADLGPVPPIGDGLSIDRPTALLLIPEPDTAYYRINLATFIYTDLATAVAAQDVLKTRLDELVTDWQTYLGQFLADGSVKPIDVTDHPRYTQDAYTALVQSYVTAVKTEATAKTTVDDAKTDYDDATTAGISAQALVTLLQQLLTDYTAGVYTDVAPFVSGWKTTFRATAETVYADDSGGTPAVLANYVAARTAADALTNPTVNVEAFYIELGGQLATARTAKLTADSVVAAKRTAYEDAKAAYTAAQAATEANLAAVRSLKPSFDPLTDIPAGVS
jgi:hypothetical protein